ncbi:MAG: type II toxin-antitoxin system VapC family toxin [Gammaproteobacteria bacterium]
MILYLDTSAILKLYFEEKGSVVVRQAVAVARIVTCHRIAYAEARSAFAVKFRERKLNVRQAAACREDFQRDWS